MPLLVNVLLFAFCLFSIVAHAAGIQTTPTSFYLNENDLTTSLNIKNQNDESILLQLRVMKWTQKASNDPNVYEKTTDVVLTPPILSLSSNEGRLVRIGLRKWPNSDSEISYRIFVKQVLTRAQQHAPGVHTLLQISMPLFITPTKINKKLNWQIKAIGKDKILLSLHNQSNIHVLISELMLQESGQTRPIIKQSVFNYLLPQQSKSWPLKLTAPLTSASLKLLAQSDWGEIVENLHLAVP